MKIYLVGGAVRDSLLNIKIKEKDWVVVGSNIKEMKILGYKKVGKKFPVFINKYTGEEYSLARTEKKNGLGYHGFDFYFSKKTTLIEDLYRRDITINAIAKDIFNNKIIDPYNGLSDIKNKIIKHVSEKFSDDPLRVLRVARFFSYLYFLGFKIDNNTFILLKKISKSGELKYLSNNRIWIETKKSMFTKNPELFFITLYYCNALKYVFPEIYNLINIFNINIKKLYFKYRYYIKNLNNNYIIKFFSLIYIIYEYILNKIYCNKIKKKVNRYLENLCKRLILPNELKTHINKIDEYYELKKNLKTKNFKKIIFFINNLNINKFSDNFYFFINSTFINQNKKKIFILNNTFYTKEKFLRKICFIINSVSIKKIIFDGYKSINIKKELLIRQKKKILLYFINLYR